MNHLEHPDSIDGIIKEVEAYLPRGQLFRLHAPHRAEAQTLRRHLHDELP